MKTMLYVVGENGRNELALSHSNEVTKLTKCELNDLTIKEIHKTMNTTIFMDHDHHIWITGDNQYDAHNTTLSKVSYFDNNHIQIHKICANACGECVFFISNEQKAYGTSNDHKQELAMLHNDNPIKPMLIESLNNVICIKSGYHCSIAMCSASNIEWNMKENIIKDWSAKNKINIPNEIIREIKQYQDFNQIYSTECQRRYSSNKIWHKMELFKDTHIIKIACGAYHSLLLGHDGNVWCLGYNECAQLGLGYIHKFDNAEPVQPTLITYFSEKGIKIRNISCGFQHSLAIDYNGNIYSWGYNGEGQCGQGQTDYILEPKLIKPLRGYKIISIKSGGCHSYAKSEDHEHFMFGDNSYFECSLVPDESNAVIIPICIDPIFKQLTDGKYIKDIYLGSLNTIIIAEQQDEI